MMSFFRKKNGNESPLQEKAAGKFVAAVLWLQHKWTGYMDRKINRLSVRSKKFGLMVFVGLSVLIVVSIQVETFTANHKGDFKIGRMRNVSVKNDKANSLVPHQYKRIQLFLKYMDSVGAVPGRQTYDSIMKCRPGLLDSAKEIEKLYQK
jgi:hypothetical protein